MLDKKFFSSWKSKIKWCFTWNGSTKKTLFIEKILSSRFFTCVRIYAFFNNMCLIWEQLSIGSFYSSAMSGKQCFIKGIGFWKSNNSLLRDPEYVRGLFESYWDNPYTCIFLFKWRILKILTSTHKVALDLQLTIKEIKLHMVILLFIVTRFFACSTYVLVTIRK